MKKNTFLLWGMSLLLTIPALRAQQSEINNTAESPSYDKSVLVIPFNPDYYFSDADRQLADQNGKNLPEIRDMFRYGLDLNLRARILSKNLDAEGMMYRSYLNDQPDLYHIYRGIGYRMEKPMLGFFEEDENKESKIKTFIQSLKHKEPDATTGKDIMQTGHVVAGQPEQKYMNVVIHDQEMLAYFSEEYQVDLVMFINQFEVITHFEHCLDRSLGNYSRELKIHFSIFDIAGTQLYGNAVSVYHDSGSFDLDRLIEDQFPLIADFMADRLLPPSPEMTSYYE